MYKARLEAVEVSGSNPYIYFNMQLQAIIKSGMSQVAEEMMWVPTLGGQLRGGPGVCELTHWASSPGTDTAAMPLTMKKFVTHATCHDSLELQEQETYLIMGQTSDLWRVKSECVGASCCPGDSGLGPLPYHSPVPSVKISTASVSRSLGSESCTEQRCRLCTAQLQGTPFTETL